MARTSPLLQGRRPGLRVSGFPHAAWHPAGAGDPVLAFATERADSFGGQCVARPSCTATCSPGAARQVMAVVDKLRANARGLGQTGVIIVAADLVLKALTLNAAVDRIWGRHGETSGHTYAASSRCWSRCRSVSARWRGCCSSRVVLCPLDAGRERFLTTSSTRYKLVRRWCWFDPALSMGASQGYTPGARH